MDKIYCEPFSRLTFVLQEKAVYFCPCFLHVFSIRLAFFCLALLGLVNGCVLDTKASAQTVLEGINEAEDIEEEEANENKIVYVVQKSEDDFSQEVLLNVEHISIIIANIVIAFGGILGLKYIRKLREKQKDATFSYLMRLNVRLKYFDETLKIYKHDIMDRFVLSNVRRELSGDRIHLVTNIVNQVSENAKETLQFIKDQNEQLPAQRGWVDKFNIFIELLLDCERLSNSSYFKWRDPDDPEKEKYFKKHSENIECLLKMVKERQCKLEEEMFRKDKKK